MSNPVSRIIHLINGVHEIRNGGLPVIRAAAMSPKHFPKFLSSVMLASGITGYCIMDYVHRSRIARQDEMYIAAWETNKGSHQGRMENMTENQAMVHAMVQNAKSASFRENLENAAVAQEKFMFVQSNGDDEKQEAFLDKIRKRSEEIRQVVSE